MPTPITISPNFDKILRFLSPLEERETKLPNPFDEKFSDIQPILNSKPRPKEKPHIPKPTESIVTKCSDASLLFMNINSRPSKLERTN